MKERKRNNDLLFWQIFILRFFSKPKKAAALGQPSFSGDADLLCQLGFEE